MRTAAGWIVPAATLAVVPKCPACFAAYFAMATGMGLSLTTAGYSRYLIISLCVGSLVYMTARMMLRRLPRLRTLFHS
ncbi:MAG: hypothetical protein QM775_07670 [Pirellulales bacterium]